MRKTASKILLLLAMMALVFVLSACNRDTDDPPPADPGPGPGQQQQQQQEEAPPIPQIPMGNVHPIQDMGGRVIRITSWGYASLDGAAPYEEPDPEDPNYFFHRLQYDNMRRVEREFNVTIQHVDGGGYGDHREGFIAGQIGGNPVGELVRASGTFMIHALAGGHAMNLNNLNTGEHNFDLFGNRDHVRPAFQLAGNTYSMRTAAPSGMVNMLAVNMDLVSRLGLPNPVEMYEAGTWTWTEFMDIMRMAKAQGYWGVAGGSGNLGRNITGSNDAVFLDADLNFAATHPNTIAAFQFIQDIFNEGLFRYDEALGPADTQWQFQFNVFFEQADSVFFAEPGWSARLEWPFEFAIIPMPLGPNNTTGTTAYTTVSYGIIIPDGTPNPEQVLIIFEELNSWAIGNEWMLVENVAEGLRSRLHTEGCVQRAIYHSNNTVMPELGWSTFLAGMNWMWYGVLSNLITGYDDAATLLEAQRGPQQEFLDNLFRN